jgi:hypothetical protein
MVVEHRTLLARRRPGSGEVSLNIGGNRESAQLWHQFDTESVDTTTQRNNFPVHCLCKPHEIIGQ